jgi:proteasome component ECM29
MLSDRDDFAQDIAAKGLGLAYSLGNGDEQSDLVRHLVSTINGDDKADKEKLMPMTADTQLFDNQSMASAPDGTALTSYKEICSLASELNKPDLVYKFLSLASHHQLWNSKKGAAFGVTQILGKNNRK